MNRRNFIISVSGLSLGIFTYNNLFANKAGKVSGKAAGNEEIFDFIISKAKKNNWKKLPIGELEINIGLEMTGTPYIGGTLEGEGPEICRTNLGGLDCVTYVENVLAMARLVKEGKHSYEDFTREIIKIRYRDGKLDGYLSRLHYTSDWICNNIKKDIFKDITRHIANFAGENLCLVKTPGVSFMSQNPQFYPALKNDSTMVTATAEIEKEINRTNINVIPKEIINDIAKGIHSGDIICLATNKKGLDYAHIGFAYVKDGSARLLHASSKKKEVVLDVSIHDYADSVSSITGITVVRPV